MSTLKVNALQDTSGNPLSRVLQAATTVDTSSTQSINSTSYVDGAYVSMSTGNIASGIFDFYGVK